MDAVGTTKIIIPDMNCVQEVCHRVYERKECVAIPTECTYESIQSFQCSPVSAHESLKLLSSTTKLQAPHVYIPNVSILYTASFWKQMLPKKSYAIRKESTEASTVAVIASFNETVHVVRRIATKCWPGPILIYIQVPQPIPGLSVTIPTKTNVDQCYTNESHVQHYIAIRNPCHPLSRKICTEFYKQQATVLRQQTPSTRRSSSSCTTTPSSSPLLTSKKPETSMLSSSLSSSALPMQALDGTLPPFMISPCRVESTTSLPGLLERDGKSTATQQNEGRSDPSILKRLEFLIGTPLMKVSNRKLKGGSLKQDLSNDVSVLECTSTKYVRSADEAIAVTGRQDSNHNVTAVLHGEERHEILSVPTCMYQRPYPTSIWIDSENRTVRIKNNQLQLSQEHHVTSFGLVQQRTESPQSIIPLNSSLTSLQEEQSYDIDVASILQSLRGVHGHMVRKLSSSTSFGLRPSTPQPPSLSAPLVPREALSPQERVLHAVLLKWKVVAENDDN
jgi:hypothetical protein